ncbi:MAG TPA: glycosyltransferase family 39 protein [Myxococcales bacterium]
MEGGPAQQPPLAALEAWLAARRGRVAAALVTAAVFVRLLFCLQVAGGPLPRLHDYLKDSDNRFFEEWATHLAAGDWLQRVPLHPMHRWMEQTALAAAQADPTLAARAGLSSTQAAEPSKLASGLWDFWLAGTTWYQEPAYPYLVAITWRLTGSDPWHVYLWQLALGVLTVALIWSLSRKLFGETAGLVAAALAVLAPAPLMLEVSLLRDSLVIFTTVLLAWLMAWAAEEEEGSRSRWFVLGICFGAAVLVKTTFVLFPVLLAVWRLATVRSRWRDRLPAAGLAAAGMALALLPAIARNLAVGARPFSFASGAATMALYLTAHATPFELVPSQLYSNVLVASDGRFLATLVAAVKSHPSLGSFAALLGSKLLYAWHGYEGAQNVDLALFKQGSSVLALLPVGMPLLVPLACVGVASRKGWPAAIAVLASIPTLLLALVVTRFRAPLLAALMPLAGYGAVRIASAAFRKRWIPLGAGAVVAGLYLVWASVPPAGLEPGRRAPFYAREGKKALDLGAHEFAALHFAEAMRLAPGDHESELHLGQALLGMKEPEEALPHLSRAAEVLATGEAREALADALVQLGRKDEARAQLRAAVAAEPGRDSARRRLEGLGE